MKKSIVVVSLVAMLFVVASPAMNEAWAGGHYGGRGYYHGHGGNGWAIAGAVAGGLVLGGIIANSMSAPVHYAPPPPPPAYYVAPAPRGYYYVPPPPPPRVYVYPY